MSTVLVATPSLKRPFDAMMMTSVCKRQRIEAAPAPQRQRHRVRFSANDSIHAVDAFDEETKSMLYWSREEMRGIVHREAQLIQVFGSCATYVVDQVVDLIHMAFGLEPMPEKNRDDSDDSDSEDDDKKSSNHNHNHNSNTNNDAKLWVANSPARGLEKDLVPELRQRKLRIIRQVLDSQADLHHWRDEVTGECASHELISSALAIHCQNLSEPAMKFAQLVATGDAQVVQAEQEAGRMRTSQC